MMTSGTTRSEHDNRLLPALEKLRSTLAQKGLDFHDIVKIGRTHLQDATPLTLGQEFSGYAAQLVHGEKHVRDALPRLCELALLTGLPTTNAGDRAESAHQLRQGGFHRQESAQGRQQLARCGDCLRPCHG